VYFSFKLHSLRQIYDYWCD